VSRGGRGATAPGRRAALPQPRYQPPPTTVVTPGEGLLVGFEGEDGRRAVFRVDRLPLPGWHGPLAAAWAQRIGPAGGLRTDASVRAAWGSLGRWMRFLARQATPPTRPDALRVAHVEEFFAKRTAGSEYGSKDLHVLAQLVKLSPLSEQVSAEVHDFLSRRLGRLGKPKPGYSDAEFTSLLRAARRDVAAIRDRLSAAEGLLSRYRAQPHTLSPAIAADAAVLDAMATTGVVPGGLRPVGRVQLAQRLFLALPDLLPLLVLMVAVTGVNVETIKELPAEHRLLEGQAVELRLIKRRRGPGQWWRTVTWEIGPPNRALHTPGGLYLLAHRLTARGRALTGTPGLWAAWRNGFPTGVAGVDEHCDPFAATLRAQLKGPEWAARHGLHAEANAPDEPPQPLRLDFNRLRTSIEVRRTRRLGGHLPTAARTNTIPVLFRHYLRGDPIVVDWAAEVVTEAVVDAERAALAAHQRAMRLAGGGPQVVAGPVIPQRRQSITTARPPSLPAGPVVDGPWSACRNPQQHPATGSACEASFLDCFHCGNCLVTTEHLPRLLGLLDALNVRRVHLSEDDWWARYGGTWAAIRHDVLSKFTPAQIEQATAAKPPDVLLDLVDNPWEAQ
jgi:hypothetical protein